MKDGDDLVKKFLCTTAAFPRSLSDHLRHAITANDGDDEFDDHDNMMI